MSRIKFKKRAQVNFLTDVRNEMSVGWPELAKILRVHSRTLSDWKRGEYTLPEKVFEKCKKITKGKVEIPTHKVLPDFWSTKKAARKAWEVLVERYGGIPLWVCRKGGLTFAKKRKLHPELYRRCSIGRRKNILIPSESSELAEFFGIVLGDGGITDKQVIISLNREDHKEYACFIRELIRKLFNIKTPVYHYHTAANKNKIAVTISSKNLVEFLLSKGLKKGNKVRQQVGVPKWIKESIQFSRSCLRGLIDTDGGVYFHRHKCHGCECFNIGLVFTNHSLPLLDFVKDTLFVLGFTPKYSSRKTDINLYREPEVYRYDREIEFHNPYHGERLRKFFETKRAFLRRDVGNW